MGQTVKVSAGSEWKSPNGTILSDSTIYSIVQQSRRLGSGRTRIVYELSDELVLKIGNTVTGNISDTNLGEAEVWDKVCNSADAGYFAQVHAVSESGDWLVMERVATVGADGDDWEVVEEIASNWGVYDVCPEINSGYRADGSICIIDYACCDTDGSVDSDSPWAGARSLSGSPVCSHDEESVRCGCDCEFHHNSATCDDCILNKTWCDGCGIDLQVYRYGYLNSSAALNRLRLIVPQYGVSVHVCGNCKPVTVEQFRWMLRKDTNQGRLF